MAEIRKIPAGLNITCAIGDEVIIDIFVKENEEPLDISGWDLESENVFFEVIDATIGHVQLAFNQDASNSKLNRWFLRRAEPNPKRLIAGVVQFVLTSDSSTPNETFDLNIVESPELSLTVITGDKGATGPTGPQGEKGDKGDEGPNDIGGFPILITNIQEKDILQFNSEAWRNKPQEVLTDGGNF
jgi:hypothetical protein